MSYNKGEKTSMGSSATDKSKTPFISLGGAMIIGFFIAAALLTIFIPTDEESTSDGDQNAIENTSLNEENRQVIEEENKDNSSFTQSEENKVTEEKPVVVNEILGPDPFEELSNMIGLDSVKAEVKSLTNYIKLMQEREAKGLKSPNISYHCVFSGNPGTGKTTVARILARIYRDLGVVSKGHLVETDRNGLIGSYVGQTGPKTNALIDSALGGVLFIDEAYGLLDNGGYGDEAIATLLKRMEDDRDDLVVIVAGYTNEMKHFIETNPGLQSRFTRYINFPDYSPEELYKIFEARMKPYSLTLDKEASEKLRSVLNTVFKNKTRNFGNGRYVRNLFENSVTNMANRISKKSNPTEDDLNTICKEDIEAAFKQVKY